MHVLDPFTGTGTFVARLVQSGLIAADDLPRKYGREIHANEILLLAYYIAAVNIETTYHDARRRSGGEPEYEPFGGIVLTDTFNLHTARGGFPRDWLPVNSERAERQQAAPIQVIVGNPPWSAGQRSSADDNPNVAYPELERRVAETYAARSTATLKNSLYDSYKMAIRWASDRVGEQGVIAFVTNGSWIDGNADAGVRACLVDEFSSVYVLNLRGNQRTQGERSRQEGGKVFGSGSRAPVAVMMLVRNPNAQHDGCRILYHDIGDYLMREEKLATLRQAGSITGIDAWREITPNRHHDWIGQRNAAYQALYPMGSKAAKVGKPDETVFELSSNGYKTSRDAYTYNFSRMDCEENARKMVSDYLCAMHYLAEHPASTIDDAASRHDTNVRWDRELKNNLKRRKAAVYSPRNVWTTQYRPFVKQHCYVDYVLVNNKYQLDRMFPVADSENRAICVPGLGSTKPFSALVVDTMPDLHLEASGTQCFPRYRYEHRPGSSLLDEQPGLERIDNIGDTALQRFREHYQDDTITKDAIFDYVYGVLHAPSYRLCFANDLAKELPRVPLAPDFHAFAAGGRALADLHLGYATSAEYPLTIVGALPGDPLPEHYRISERPMRFADDAKCTLIVNDHIRLAGIPAEAHEYQVNGRTPLGWFIDRYKVTRDKRSGIVNDPNGWFEDPIDLLVAIRRIVQVSVDTVRIVEGLPERLGIEAEIQ